MSIILEDDTLKELEKLKALLGKNMSMNELIKLMVKTTIEKVEKDKFKQTSKPKVERQAKVKQKQTYASNQDLLSPEKVKLEQTLTQQTNLLPPEKVDFAGKQNLLSPVKATRIIANQVKREVYKRDKQCTNCGTKHRLNFDHRIPHALSGGNATANIRLLCFHCNQRGRMQAKL